MCGNRADAEDLVQETYVTLLRRPRRLTGSSELAYLMTMLRNRHIDECRTAARRQTTLGLYEVEDSPDPRAGLRPDRVSEQREVLEAVHALDSPFRETVVAVDVLGLSYKEAARRCPCRSGRSCRASRAAASGSSASLEPVAPRASLVACA